MVNASDLLQDAGAVGELALVAADLVDRGQVGILERGNDLLDVETVVARERLASTHVAQLVQHLLSVLMRALVALDRLELELRMLGKRLDYLPGVEAVIAGKRKPSLRDWLALRIVDLEARRLGGRESISDRGEDGHWLCPFPAIPPGRMKRRDR